MRDYEKLFERGIRAQREYLKKALELAEENPDMEIKVLAHYQELLPEFKWTAHKITGVSIEYWYDTECEEIITEEEFILEHFRQDLLVPEDQLDQKWDEEVCQVIAIKTEAR